MGVRRRRVRRFRAPSPSAASRSKSGLEILADQPSFEHGREFLHDVVKRAGRGLAEAAMARRAHELVQPRQFVQFVARAVAGGDLVHDARTSAVPTRHGVQKPQTLVREEMREIERRVEQVAVRCRTP